MARVGNTFEDYHYWTGTNYGNVVNGRFSVPDNGWITGMGVHAGGYGGTARSRLCIWDGNGNLEYQSSVETWGSTRAWRDRAGLGLRATKDADAKIGFYRDKTDATQFSTNHGPDNDVKVSTFLPDSYGSAPNVGSFERYAPDLLAAYFDILYNVAPSVGAWSSPTPANNATDADTGQILSGTMPHNGGDGAFDFTETVQVLVRRESNGALLANSSFEPTGAERTAGKWSRKIVDLPPGAWVTAEFRHRDSWGVWSGYSALRRFMANSGPSAPVLTSPAAKVNVLPFTIAGDYFSQTGVASEGVQIEVWNEAKTIMLVSSTWSGIPVTPWSRSSAGVMFGSFVFEYGKVYNVRARVRDTSLVAGPFSAYVKTTINSKPSIPSSLVPQGGKATSSNVLSMKVADPNKDPITAALAEISTQAGATVFNSPVWALRVSMPLNTERRPTAPNGNRYRATTGGVSGPTQPVWPTAAGATVRDNAGLAAVGRSAAIALNAGVLKPGGVSADATWYQCTTLGTTDAVAPVYPTTVGTSVTDGTAVFVCRATVVWTQWGDDKSFAMTVNNTTGAATLTAALLTLGIAYRWRARVTDGFQPGYGDYTAWMDFVYDSVPEVVILSPDAEANRNLVAQPSAEYDPAVVGAYWTNTGIISRASDGDTSWGNWCWRVVAPGGTSIVQETRFMAVDPTKPHRVTCEIKKEVGSAEPVWNLQLVYFDAAGAFLGVSQFLSGATTPTSWTIFGGFIAANTMPAGTVSATIKFHASLANSPASTMRFDSFTLKPVKSLGVNVHGYFDGDTAPSIPPDDYLWEGVVGNSVSVGRNIVDNLAVTLDISYASNAAKTHDQTVIEEWNGAVWSPLDDTGLIASARVAVPMNTAKLRNLGRYRVKTFARNANALVGETDWAIFDFLLDGPPEINIIVAEPNSDDATVRLVFEASTVSPTEYVATEIAREPVEGGLRETIKVITDPLQTEFIYHAPVNGENNRFLMRQIALIGANKVASRWVGANVLVEYRQWHLKDLEEPESYNLAFDLQAEDEPSFGRKIDKARFRPWGSGKLTHLSGRERAKNGSFVVRIQAHKTNTQEDIEKLEEFFQRGRGYILLCPRPARKLFVSIDEFGETSGSLTWESIWNLAWEETYYVEDEYLSGRFDGS